jgi:translocation and assembly module TamB
MIRRIFGGLVLVLVITAAVLWFARRSIADTAIASELTKRGVTATYRVAEIGFRWQRLENIRIGDPKAPDLTADWAEVALEADFNGVRTTKVRAGGVRLRGRLIDGTVRWGQLDKLLTKGSGGPFALPALDVDIRDARIGLDTPYGALGARLDGQGRLDNGFVGKLAAIVPQLAVKGCTATHLTAYIDVAIRAGAPFVRGPVRTGRAQCNGVAVTASSLVVDASLSKSFEAWRGSATLDVGALSTAVMAFGGITGRLDFAGTGAETTGKAQLAAPRATAAATQLVGLGFSGGYSIQRDGGQAQGRVSVANAVPDARTMSVIRSAFGTLAGTPVAPIGIQLADAVARAGNGGSIDADFAAVVRASAVSGSVTRLTARTPSGAQLLMTGGSGLKFGASGLVIDTRLAMSGGGFPTIDADFKRGADGESRGIARIAHYDAGGASIALTPVSFLARSDGYLRAATVATINGSLPNGRIVGLQTPLVVAIDGRGSTIVNPGCAPLAFAALDLQSLHVGPAVLQLCPTGDAMLRYSGGRASGGVNIVAPRLNGRLGATPVTLLANTARLTLTDGAVRVAGIKTLLGSGESASHLDIAMLDGRLSGGSVSGRFAGLMGVIGRVPLRVDEGAGPWRFANGVLNVGGKARVADSADSGRFRPLEATDVALRLADGRISLAANLRVPESGVSVAALNLSHNLAQGRGTATLGVQGIDFGTTIQPETITPLTTGVVAFVVGRVAGQGDVAWDAKGVTSRGRFETKGLDLAAAFGQVRGLRGEIVFTDLLGLVTAPGQVATIDTVNPGIAVGDGVVRYRLAVGQKIVVEDGRWPFAGGELTLDPATLDMAEQSERKLTFRIEGLDAAKFIEQLQLQDIAATGFFDGTIPIIFDSSGGRVEGGRIVARPDGGTLAYIGEVSRANMNPFAKLAFDALRSMKYRNLEIGLQGPLDGEMINTVNFTGVNQGSVTTKRSYLARQFNNLPFKFNITFRAPFRSLLSTAQKIQNPLLLLRNPPPSAPPIIQPPESEKRP